MTEHGEKGLRQIKTDLKAMHNAYPLAAWPNLRRQYLAWYGHVKRRYILKIHMYSGTEGSIDHLCEAHKRILHCFILVE